MRAGAGMRSRSGRANVQKYMRRSGAEAREGCGEVWRGWVSLDEPDRSRKEFSSGLGLTREERRASCAIDYGVTSSPYDGWLKLPSILMGTISPAFFFLKNGSTDLSRTDFTPFDPRESLLSTCKVP